MAGQISTFFWAILTKYSKENAVPSANPQPSALKSSDVQIMSIGVVHRDIQTTNSLDVDTALAMLKRPAPYGPYGRKDVYVRFSPNFVDGALADAWINDKTNFDPNKNDEYAELCITRVTFSSNDWVPPTP